MAAGPCLSLTSALFPPKLLDPFLPTVSSWSPQPPLQYWNSLLILALCKFPKVISHDPAYLWGKTFIFLIFPKLQLDSITDSKNMIQAYSRRQWRTGKSGVLQSTGSQRVIHDWVTEPKSSFILRFLIILCVLQLALRPLQRPSTLLSLFLRIFCSCHREMYLNSESRYMPFPMSFSVDIQYFGLYYTYFRFFVCCFILYSHTFLCTYVKTRIME